MSIDQQIHENHSSWFQEDEKWAKQLAQWEGEWQDKLQVLQNAVSETAHHTHALSLYKKMIDSDKRLITAEEIALIARRWFIGGDASEHKIEQTTFETNEEVHKMLETVHNGIAYRHERLLEAIDAFAKEVALDTGV